LKAVVSAAFLLVLMFAGCLSQGRMGASTTSTYAQKDSTTTSTGTTTTHKTTTSTTTTTLPAEACTVDSDCMTSSCCHPTSCVKGYQRVCNMLCTASCEGPLDCGRGRCGCINGKCGVIPATKPGINCSVNSDCGAETNESVYCEGNVIKMRVGTPVCRSPGTPESRCILRERVQAYLDCGGDYCFRGRCYPAACDNQELDYNEVDVDCGGVCPPCDSTAGKRCGKDSDCGPDHYLPGFSCYEGDIMRQYVNYTCNVNGTCSYETGLAGYRECNGDYRCFIGDMGCRVRERTCGNCVRDGGEERVDCGGSCWPCAPRPTQNASEYGYTVIYFPDSDDVFQYGGYDLRYMRPLYSGYGEDNCTYGAVIRVRQPDLTTADLGVTRYRNNGVGGIVLGFYSAGEWGARIWVTG